jgi:UPF0716 family protein affecting phage T7 exclusion
VERPGAPGWLGLRLLARGPEALRARKACATPSRSLTLGPVRWLLLVPLFVVVEIVLLVLAGMTLGVWPTLGLLLVSAVLGVLFARSEGLRVWRSYRQALREGRMPEEGILSGLLLLLGGALLLIPGFLSDVVGIALLIPYSRRWVATRLQAYLRQRLGQLPVVQLSVAEGLGFDTGPTEGWMPEEEEPREVIDTEGVVVQTERLLGTGCEVLDPIGDAEQSTVSKRRE